MRPTSPGIAFRPAPTERCPVTPCASRAFAWQVYVLLHGDNVLTDILVAIDAAVHVQGLLAAKVRESVFKLSSCLQSTLKFSSPVARYRCTISSPAAGLGRAILSDPFLELALHFQLELAGSHSSLIRGRRPRRFAASRRRHSPYRRHRHHATWMASPPPLLLRLPPSARCRHRRAPAIVQWARSLPASRVRHGRVCVGENVQRVNSL